MKKVCCRKFWFIYYYFYHIFLFIGINIVIRVVKKGNMVQLTKKIQSGEAITNQTHQLKTLKSNKLLNRRKKNKRKRKRKNNNNNNNSKGEQKAERETCIEGHIYPLPHSHSFLLGFTDTCTYNFLPNPYNCNSIRNCTIAGIQIISTLIASEFISEGKLLGRSRCFDLDTE